MSFKDWLLLKDWCYCIPYLSLCTVTSGLVLCPQPSYLRSDGFARDNVLWKDRMEGWRWEITLVLMYFNEKWNEILPSCQLLFLSFSPGSPGCKLLLSWSQNLRLRDFLQLQICPCCGPSYFAYLLTHLCVYEPVPPILSHITSDMSY